MEDHNANGDMQRLGRLDAVIPNMYRYEPPPPMLPNDSLNLINHPMVNPANGAYMIAAMPESVMTSVEHSPERMKMLSEQAKNDMNNFTSGQKRRNILFPEQTTSKRVALPTAEEKKNNQLRKNIRDVMDETNLDTTTLAAQKEEAERLARVADQQKSMREIQKQVVHKQFFRILQLDQSEDLNKCAVNNHINEAPIDLHEDELASETLDETNSSLSCSIDDVLNKEVHPDESNEVVTIDDSSDDDCILLSEEEEEEDEDLNESDDATNSGMHVKDAYNIPDEDGRVVVNMAHPEGEETIYLAPQISKVIKPHQIGGVRFLYDNIIESTRRFSKSSGFGCILAHSMGLGKTLQVVSFCDIFLRHTSAKTVLCVMPINTLQNWLSEFNMWVPRQSADQNIRPRNFDIFVLNDQQKTLTARAKVILNWVHEGGVLLIGYELFRLLALKLATTRKRKANKNPHRIDGYDSSSNLMNMVFEALVKPGPDLVICDEGHRIKNSHAGISVALKQIRTRRRIVLTGYPLQNNLLEYWCMVDFVRPNYLGTRTEFCNMFERPIQNGQCVDSTPDDIKLMRYRAHVLHSLLLGFVQRRSHTVLQSTLPKKLEYVIFVKMTAFQRKLYETFMTDVVRKKAFPNPLKAFAVCCKIWNHPDVLYNFLKKCETDLDLEIDEELTKNAAAPAVECNPNNTISTAPSVPEKNADATFEQLPAKPNVNSFQIPPTADRSTEKYASPSSNYYEENRDQINFGGYSCEAKTNYWLESSILSKPACVEAIKQNDSIMTKDLENISGSSEIVDLDTNEIKTVETSIQHSSTSKQLDTDYLANPSIGNNISRMKQMTSINVEATKKIIRSKRNDEFSCGWAVDLMKNYVADQISNSPKMEIFFTIMRESINLGDRILLFSQSLLTLNLIEGFLKASYVPGNHELWTRNISYFRLDGSTSSQERERLVNEFNSNSNVKLFLISTRAGSLGINLTGANRVIIFDASWNPCHDTQAVYRIYRYGQTKPCYVYRIVMDKCLEKKIYDRQIKKQGMSDRIVDECNPEAHLSMKDITNLCHDDNSDDENSNETPKVAADVKAEEKPDEKADLKANEKTDEKSDEIVDEKLKEQAREKPEENVDEKADGKVDDKADVKTGGNEEENGKVESPVVVPKTPKEEAEFSQNHEDAIINSIIQLHRNYITKEPFFHDSLLVDQKDRKLSQAEKRQAHRSYEQEKKASVNQKFICTPNKMNYKIVNNDGTIISRPVASIRPMQTKKNNTACSGGRTTRWIPADVWQRQGMTAQEMTLPLDVVIPTNSSDKANIILKAGQRVMVLKSTKGIYMQLDSGKIIAIRTTNKSTDGEKPAKDDIIDITSDCDTDAPKSQSPEDGEKSGDGKQTHLENKESEHTITTNNDQVSSKENRLSENIQQVKHHTQQNTPATATQFNLSQNQHQLPCNLDYIQQQQQQPYKHQSQLPPNISEAAYNSVNVPLSNPLVPNADLTENAYFQSKHFQHTYPPQYYDYYDNKHKPAAPSSSYHLNNYASYGNLNFAPYHSNLHATPGYSASPSSYVNSNTFPRQHWSTVASAPASNEPIRQQSYLGGTYPMNDWTPQ